MLLLFMVGIGFFLMNDIKCIYFLIKLINIIKEIKMGILIGNVDFL